MRDLFPPPTPEVAITNLLLLTSAQLCLTLHCGLPGSSVPWDFPGKNTGLGSHFLLQGIFMTQGLNPGLPHCRQTLYHLSHQGIHQEFFF